MCNLKQKKYFYLYSTVNKCPAVMNEGFENLKMRNNGM